MGKKCEKWENREEKIKGGRGEEEGGKMLKLEATVSEITYASCLKFFCVFAMFHCSLTTVMPKLFFVCVCVWLLSEKECIFHFSCIPRSDHHHSRL